MKTVKALVAFSNGVISMEQYEVRELPTDMANDLIAAGICVEAGGGSGGGVLVVHENEDDWTLDKTYAEINTALSQGIVYVARSREHDNSNFGIIIGAKGGGNRYIVWGLVRNSANPSFSDWVASTEDGYPVASED